MPSLYVFKLNGEIVLVVGYTFNQARTLVSANTYDLVTLVDIFELANYHHSAGIVNLKTQNAKV